MRASITFAGHLILMALLLVWQSTAFAEPKSTDVAEPAPAAVVFNNEPLFFVYSKLGPFSPEDRARAAEGRLARLAKDPSAKIDDITVVEGERAVEIVCGETVILAVTDRDAAALGKAPQEVARDYARTIKRALERVHGELSLRALAVDALWAVLATVVLLLALWLLKVLFRKALLKLEGWKGTYIHSIKIQRVELLSADQILAAALWLIKALRITAMAFLLYSYLTSVLGFFPWTRKLSEQLLGYLLSPVAAIVQAFTTHIPDLIAIVVIVFVTRYITKLVHVLFSGIERGAVTFPGFHRDWAQPTYKIVRFLIFALAAIAIFPYVPGSHSPAFQGISVFLGVLFSLGSTGAVSNVVSGIVLTYMRPFQIGDRVKIAETIGDVTERELLVTRIRTIKNVDITIPNAMVLGSHIINYSSSANERGLILHTAVTIGYDAPWKTVHDLLIAAAKATPRILETPQPYVLQTSLNDFYVTYELNAYTAEPNQMAETYSLLHQHIQDTFNEAGVEIMSPHYTQIRDGNKTTIPDAYLPQTYTAPAFRITSVEPMSSRPNGELSKDRLRPS
ncbi:mechanosensitive ion channel family protein [Candidatus Nitrospira bockiana]